MFHFYKVIGSYSFYIDTIAFIHHTGFPPYRRGLGFQIMLNVNSKIANGKYKITRRLGSFKIGCE